MGNINSKGGNIHYNETGTNTETRSENKHILLENEIDYIATHYILTMNFQSLRNLYNKKYCDDLIILTSEIINKYFKDLQVDKLIDRVENGLFDSDVSEQHQLERTVFINKNDMERVIKLSNQQDKMEKCRQISEFYIKIAHIFSAIVTTINPEYIHTDNTGKITKYKLSEKHKIPKSGHVEIFKTNLCGERMDILKNELFSNLLSHNNKDNYNNDNPIPKPQPNKLCFFKEGKTLEDEPGIPELLDLYYDADFDFKTGKFTGMTPKTSAQFQKDLNKFYTEYTGNLVVPDNIKKFSDIPLRDYSKKKYCQEKSSQTFDQNQEQQNEEQKEQSNEEQKEQSNKIQLFQEYAKNLNSMINSVNEKDDELVSILNQIFVYIGDDQDKHVTIHPDLNENSLQSGVILFFMIFSSAKNLLYQFYLIYTRFIQSL
jgi:hypothetical protein